MPDDIRVVGYLTYRGLALRVLNYCGTYVVAVNIPEGMDSWCAGYMERNEVAMSKREFGWLNGYPGARISFGRKRDRYHYTVWLDHGDGPWPEDDDEAFKSAKLIADYCKVHIDELNKGHV